MHVLSPRVHATFSGGLNVHSCSVSVTMAMPWLQLLQVRIAESFETTAADPQALMG